MNLVPVILCGGAGSRLWPLSRSAMPKQLLPLITDRSMLQETAARLGALSAQVASPVLICNEAHRFIAAAQLRDMQLEPTVVLEPAGRNTAPAVAVAALLQPAAERNSTLLLILPADHVIQNVEVFSAAVERAQRAAEAGRLATFGIVPTRAETGYGYIRAGARVDDVFEVEQFVEKPDRATAESYLASGDYFWNSGMFMFTASAFLDELARHAPDMLEACERAVAGASDSGGMIRLDEAAFRSCPSDSIDYAVMEHTQRAAVVPLDAGWNDVGSWAALRDVSHRDAQGNNTGGDVVAVDCQNSYLRAESRLIAAVGLDDCVVVETKDAVLVAPASRAQDVKKIVDELKLAGREETKLGREVFRPWGSYDSLENADGFQVKRLTVLPGAVLSLQLHHQRAEHWVVVAGTARITLDDDVFDLEKNQHTFIPIGARHRIENPGSSLLHIIEVQVGDYLGEDDIVRFEDKYGREGRTD